MMGGYDKHARNWKTDDTEGHAMHTELKQAFDQGYNDRMAKHAQAKPSLLMSPSTHLQLNANDPYELGIQSNQDSQNWLPTALPQNVGHRMVEGAGEGAILGGIIGHPVGHLLTNRPRVKADLGRDYESLGNVFRGRATEGELKGLLSRRVRGMAEGGWRGAALMGGITALSNGLRYLGGKMVAPKPNTMSMNMNMNMDTNKQASVRGFIDALRKHAQVTNAAPAAIQPTNWNAKAVPKPHAAHPTPITMGGPQSGFAGATKGVQPNQPVTSFAKKSNSTCCADSTCSGKTMPKNWAKPFAKKTDKKPGEVKQAGTLEQAGSLATKLDDLIPLLRARVNKDKQSGVAMSDTKQAFDQGYQDYMAAYGAKLIKQAATDDEQPDKKKPGRIHKAVSNVGHNLRTGGNIAAHSVGGSLVGAAAGIGIGQLAGALNNVLHKRSQTGVAGTAIRRGLSLGGERIGANLGAIGGAGAGIVRNINNNE